MLPLLLCCDNTPSHSRPPVSISCTRPPLQHFNHFARIIVVYPYRDSITDCHRSRHILPRYTATMPSASQKKQKRQSQSTTAQLSKRARQTSTVASSPSSTSSDSSSTSSSAVCTFSFDWADLPVELFVAISCLATYRFLFVLSSVNRRLHRLIVGERMDGAEAAGGSLQSSRVSKAHKPMWRDLPIVQLEVYHDCVVQVDGAPVSTSQRRRVPALVPHILHSLRHIPAFALAMATGHDKRTPGDGHINEPMRHACLQPLQCFDQLTSLTLHLDCTEADPPSPFIPSLLTALDSLRQLRCLELQDCNWVESKELLTTLRRLCSEQLLHLGLSANLLCRLEWQDAACAIRPPPMPCVKSFRFTGPCGHLYESLTVFPSLTHVDVCYGGRFHKNITPSSVPSLLSLRIDPWHIEGKPLEVHAGLHTLVLTGSRDSRRSRVRELISHTRALRQYAVTTPPGHSHRLFEDDLLSKLEGPLASLTYLQLDGELRASQWHYMLTPTTPPPFAATLTHLLLRYHPRNLRLVTKLLPNLPLVYPALQRCYIGIQDGFGRSEAAEEQWEEWNAAVQTQQAILGAVWCDSGYDVLACRSDMNWRREAGVQYMDNLKTGKFR